MLMTNDYRQTWRERTEASQRQVTRIDVLPDDVLLEVFDFYVKTRIEAWQSLVHVCRRWRDLVFQSPRRLNLQLVFTPETPAREKLDVWPALPLIDLIVKGDISLSRTDNLIAALGHSDRVSQVSLHLVDWQLEEVLAAMQVPFPELTDLSLLSEGETMLLDPDSFLGGSAPRLRSINLFGIPFPGLPRLLSSANHLVHLYLYSIPHSGYISPEAMVALLSVLASLESFTLTFESPQYFPGLESRSPSLPPLQRSILPALYRFHFMGVIEYLEDLVTFIEAPQLENMQITFFNDIVFGTPRLAQFIDRAPKFRKRLARVKFYDSSAAVVLSAESGNLEIDIISCGVQNRQLSFVAQICSSSLPPLSTIEKLCIDYKYWRHIWKHDPIENSLWLELLLPFTALKKLYLSKEFAPDIAAALQELVGGRMTEVLPSLRNIFVEGLKPSGPFQENIGQFVTARRLSGHPVAISVWNYESGEIELSCMHSTLAYMGREADIAQWLALRGEIADEISEIFLRLRELEIAAKFGFSSLVVPNPLLKGKRNPS